MAAGLQLPGWSTKGIQLVHGLPFVSPGNVGLEGPFSLQSVYNYLSYH